MVSADSSLESLMRASLSGDARAYAALLEGTAAILRPYLAKRMARVSDVEDVLQEILISVHKARHTYDGKRPYTPWVYAIARFRLTDYLRAHYRDHLRRAVDIDTAPDISDPPVTEWGLSYESIEGEIARLSGKQPRILQLLHRDGYTAREVAAEMGMTETAVKVAAHRAYKILRRKLVNE